MKKILGVLGIALLLCLTFTTTVLAREPIDGPPPGPPVGSTGGGSGESIDSGTYKKGYPTMTHKDADSWEVILWIDGVQKGDIVIYGSHALANMKTNSSDSGNMSQLQKLDWGNSKTKKSQITTSGGYKTKQRTSFDIKWQRQSDLHKLRSNINYLKDMMFKPMVEALQMSTAEMDKILAQQALLTDKANPLTKEEIDAKLASGEFIDWLITLASSL